MFSYREKIGDAELFMTDRYGGVSNDSFSSLNLGYYSNDDPTLVIKNRQLVCDALSIPLSHFFIPKEVHGSDIQWIDASVVKANECDSNDLVCDALITTLPRVCVGVTTADCVPVLMYDHNSRVVAAVHAGWKGVVNEIVPKTISEIKNKLNIGPEQLNVKIMSCISLEKFEVGDEVATLFESKFENSSYPIVDRTHYEKPHVNLRQAVKWQALSCGVLETNIEVSKECTHSEEKYFSARRDGFSSGRMVSGIMKL